jgi:hypothetical protein
MRRSIVAVVVAAGLTLSGLATGPPQAVGADPGSAPENLTDTQTEDALAAAQAALGHPAAARRTSSSRPDATLALRDLFVARDQLGGTDRLRADGLLARPTDGASDPFGNGYAVPAEKRCAGNFCIHWVTSTADAPPSGGWVDENLAYMNKVWRKEVDGLGYREPITDGRRGGNARFDVYLKELGSRGLYGYCAPERRTADFKWLASGYCVLDNDFAEAQYGAPPEDSLHVTAAHEFFHAIQFAYDYGEDGWLMESTATWMEERVADRINDNRQYLAYGQVAASAQPLDVYDPRRFNQYGNWTFFEYLSTRFGLGVVRAIWNRAGAFPGSGHAYSTAAVKGVLEARGGFADVYRSYAAANTVPARAYPEGGSWPSPRPAASWVLSTSQQRPTRTLAINHMASRAVQVRPSSTLKSRRWLLRVTVDGPAGRTAPGAAVVIKRRHGVSIKALRLDRTGKGHIAVPFSATRVRSATIVLVNASTRFACWRRTSYSCQGKPRDNNAPFTLEASVTLPKARQP